MPLLTLDVDQETYDRLADEAVSERRPIDWQAEVALRRSVGLSSDRQVPVLQTEPAR
jgi:hypothetical protein